MKNMILLIILMFMVNGCQGKSRDKNIEAQDSPAINRDTFIQKTKRKNINLKNDTIMEINYEKFDFEAAEKYVTRWGSIEMKIGDTIREIFKLKSQLSYMDYLPSSEFYVVAKKFYMNGNIKSKANLFGPVLFGIYEEYDENGYCIKKVNEDEKFGKIKREDVVRFLEKQGWFNRKTGENKVAEESPLKTDGTFYREIRRYIRIGFSRAKYDASGKEIKPPEWSIIINPYFKQHITEYDINGNTGKYKVREYDNFKYM